MSIHAVALMSSPIISRITSIIIVFSFACVNLIYFSDKLARFIGYFGAMFIIPLALAILITYSASLMKNTRARESTWVYVLNSVVSVLPSIYLLLMLKFSEGL